jgi:hypothetical protein
MVPYIDDVYIYDAVLYGATDYAFAQHVRKHAGEYCKDVKPQRNSLSFVAIVAFALPVNGAGGVSPRSRRRMSRLRE